MQQAKGVQQQQLHSRLLARGRLAVGKALATLGSTMLLNRAQYVDRVGRLSVTNQGAGRVPRELPLPVTECTERRRSQSRGDSAGNQEEPYGCGESFALERQYAVPTLMYDMPVHSNVPQHAVIKPGGSSGLQDRGVRDLK